MSGPATATAAPWEEAAQQNQQAMPWDEAKAAAKPSTAASTSEGSTTSGIIGRVGHFLKSLPPTDGRVNGQPYDPRPFGDVQDAIAYTKQHPIRAIGKGLYFAAPFLMGAMGGLSEVGPKLEYPGAPLPESRGVELGRGPQVHRDPAAGLGRIPTPQPEILPPVNVRGPGQIAPELIRPRAFPARSPEPIPSRTGLRLTGDVAPPATAGPRRVPGEIAPEAVRPRAFSARTAEPIGPRSGLALPPGPEPIAPRANWPPAEPLGPFDRLPSNKGGIRDVQDDQAVRDEVNDQIRKSDEKWKAEIRNERRLGSTKGFLTGQTDELGIPKGPVKYTKTPGVNTRLGPEPTGPTFTPKADTLFHGTGRGTLELGAGEGGTWATDDPAHAQSFGDNVHKISTKSLKIFDANTPQGGNKMMELVGDDSVESPAEFEATHWQRIKNALGREGYDGINIGPTHKDNANDVWLFKRPSLSSRRAPAASAKGNAEPQKLDEDLTPILEKSVRWARGIRQQK